MVGIKATLAHHDTNDHYAGSAIIGRLSTGLCSDHYDAWVLALINLIASTFITFVLWGFVSTTFAGIIVFGLCYGIFVAGWASNWTGLIRYVNLLFST
jgi:MFS transporter, MCT family, solute carrier family 16 (monocarboxylic acid transporters), member 10